MVTSVPMPKLGAGVYHEGVVLKWMKKEGDRVNAGEPIAEIETEKSVAEYVSPASGTVLRLLFKEGDTVEVGKTIMLLGEPGEPLPAETTPSAPPSTSPPAGVSEQGTTGVAEVSPAARRLAENLKVDLSKVVGTGPGGSVMREDILKASRASRSAPPQAIAQQRGSSIVPMTGMRSTIARRLVKSHQETAPVTLTREVEVGSLVRFVKGAPAETKVGYNDVVIKASAEALRRHPVMNSSLDADGNIRIIGSIDIGVAVALDGGLITPTVRGADRLSVQDIASAVRRLSEMARARQLQPEDYEGATFTVSNLGAFGVDAFTPIINPPQVGILGVGRVIERPWVVSGELRAVPTMVLSLTFDHRVIDGADAAKFLDSLAQLLHELSWLGGS